MTALQKYIPGKIKLTEDKLQVYLVDLRLFDAEAMASVLSAEEQQRAAKLKMKDKREQFVISRALLREVLALCLVETSAEGIYFSYGDHGKPAVNHTHMGKPIEFNLSHSGHYALIALTVTNKVGVDIEAVSDAVDKLGLAKRYFSEAETDQFKQLAKADQLDAFYRFWTRKEAFIKADGRGVSLGLGKFSVSLEEKIKAAEILVDGSVDIEGKWYNYQPVSVPGYQTAIATNSDQLHVTAHVITN